MRRRKFSEQDPVRTVKLSDWMKQRVPEAQATHGPSFVAALNALDASVASQLQTMLQ